MMIYLSKSKHISRFIDYVSMNVCRVQYQSVWLFGILSSLKHFLPPKFSVFFLRKSTTFLHARYCSSPSVPESCKKLHPKVSIPYFTIILCIPCLSSRKIFSNFQVLPSEFFFFFFKIFFVFIMFIDLFFPPRFIINLVLFHFAKRFHDRILLAFLDLPLIFCSCALSMWGFFLKRNNVVFEWKIFS